MRRFLSVVLAAGALLVAGVVAAPSANAAGGERLGCYVASGQPLSWGPPCRSKQPQYSYTVRFKVLDGTGTYSYAWNTHGWPVTSGCTSTSGECNVRAQSIQNDTAVTVSVTISQLGYSANLSATAHLLAVCFFNYDWVWC